jgi:hypothetical protein
VRFSSVNGSQNVPKQTAKNLIKIEQTGGSAASSKDATPTLVVLSLKTLCGLFPQLHKLIPSSRQN